DCEVARKHRTSSAGHEATERPDDPWSFPLTRSRVAPERGCGPPSTRPAWNTRRFMVAMIGVWIRPRGRDGGNGVRPPPCFAGNETNLGKRALARDEPPHS